MRRRAAEHGATMPLLDWRERCPTRWCCQARSAAAARRFRRVARAARPRRAGRGRQAPRRRLMHLVLLGRRRSRRLRARLHLLHRSTTARLSRLPRRGAHLLARWTRQPEMRRTRSPPPCPQDLRPRRAPLARSTHRRRALGLRTRQRRTARASRKPTTRLPLRQAGRPSRRRTRRVLRRMRPCARTLGLRRRTAGQRWLQRPTHFRRMCRAPSARRLTRRCRLRRRHRPPREPRRAAEATAPRPLRGRRPGRAARLCRAAAKGTERRSTAGAGTRPRCQPRRRVRHRRCCARLPRLPPSTLATSSPPPPRPQRPRARPALAVPSRTQSPPRRRLPRPARAREPTGARAWTEEELF